MHAVHQIFWVRNFMKLTFNKDSISMYNPKKWWCDEKYNSFWCFIRYLNWDILINYSPLMWTGRFSCLFIVRKISINLVFNAFTLPQLYFFHILVVNKELQARVYYDIYLGYRYKRISYEYLHKVGLLL